jgi:dihydroorotate dehydrogenase (NAD+) catalytic subunit
MEFGNVFCASGSRGFFGEGYWFHAYAKPFGLDYTGSTFISKTTTLAPRKGNMPLGADGISPAERHPKCIIVKPFHGVALNAVGLSGPGAAHLLETKRWQLRLEPFLISFMAVGALREDRLREAEGFVTLLRAHQRDFCAPFGIQLNVSCPNTGHDPSRLVTEAVELLTILSQLNLPLVLKVNVLTSPDSVAEILCKTICDAVTVSNTIPWGALPDRIDWKGMFGSDVSPLVQFGGGGLSGESLLPLVLEWILKARELEIPVPMIACGGILSRDDAAHLLVAGASAIEMGSVSFLRPWRVHGIISAINRGFAEKRYF